MRKEQFAHTDLKFYRPKVGKVILSGKLYYPMQRRAYAYGSLLGQLDEIEQLVHKVAESIQIEIAEYEKGL